MPNGTPDLAWNFNIVHDPEPHLLDSKHNSSLLLRCLGLGYGPQLDRQELGKRLRATMTRFRCILTEFVVMQEVRPSGCDGVDLYTTLEVTE